MLERQAICLDCRTALDAGEACDGGRRHRVVQLSEPAAREELLREVWGPPGLRRQAKRMAAAGGSGAAAGGALQCGEVGCGLLECVGGGGLPVLGVILAAAFAGVLIYLLVAYIVRVIKRRRSRLDPNGARRKQAPPRGQRFRGRITAEAGTVISPGGDKAAAYGLRLSCKRFDGSSVMLLDGISAGFPFRLSDGRVVQVPAGRVRVEAPARSGAAAPPEWVEGYLEGLDPLRKRSEADEDLDPIPYDDAHALVLRPGDPAELVAQLELVPDNRADAVDYREAAPSLLELRGSVLLRLLPRPR